ncbi:hypothetical protein XaraCFBP7407_00760 [Xanthomonas arboricola pv. arracaciae]|nr:hypothetical protein XaraCFBP7407_00760 [Xanthomonas arboricola pv. arracaciae]
MASPRTLTPTPAPRPGPRLRRGRSKARAPVARKPCLGAPAGEGLVATVVARVCSPLICAAH